MPEPGDPSAAREARRARARQAAAAASDERRAELRARYVATPAPGPDSRSSRTPRRRATSPGVIDASAIAAVARQALNAHPSTWTSYAELCSASGINRGAALVVARALIPEPTGDHWFRIRNEDGIYNVPSDEAERGDPVRYSQAEADRQLEAIGVRVINKRADRKRKLCWTEAAGWTVGG
jgi:hypothetical protein